MSKVTMQQLIEVAKEGAKHSPLLDFLYKNRDNPLVMSIYLKGINSKENDIWFMLEFTLKAFLERLSQLKTIPKFNLFILFALGLCALFPDPDVSPYLKSCGLETAAAIMIGSGLAVTGAVGSSLINAGSQRSANEANKKMTEDTNETNLQIQREVNEQNYKIWQEQLGQRNAEIAYNSPVESRARSEMAGYNPYFDDVPTGNIDSVLGATAPSMQAASMQAPHVEPVKYDFSGVTDAINSFFQNSFTASKTKEQNINNETLAARNIADLRDKLASGELKGAERKLAEFQLEAAMKKLPNELKQQIADIDMTNAKIGETQAQTAFINTQNAYQQLLMEWYPQVTQAQLDNITASTSAANASAFASYAAGKCSLKQVEVATETAFKLAAEKEGIELNNYHLRRLNPIIRENAKKTGESIDAQTAKTWQDATSLDFGIVKAPGGASMHNIKGYKKSGTYKRNK